MLLRYLLRYLAWVHLQQIAGTGRDCSVWMMYERQRTSHDGKMRELQQVTITVWEGGEVLNIHVASIGGTGNSTSGTSSCSRSSSTGVVVVVVMWQ